MKLKYLHSYTSEINSGHTQFHDISELFAPNLCATKESIQLSIIHLIKARLYKVDRLHEFLILLITPKSHLQHAVVYLTAAEVKRRVCGKNQAKTYKSIYNNNSLQQQQQQYNVRCKKKLKKNNNNKWNDEIMTKKASVIELVDMILIKVKEKENLLTLPSVAGSGLLRV